MGSTIPSLSMKTPSIRENIGHSAVEHVFNLVTEMKRPSNIHPARRHKRRADENVPVNGMALCVPQHSGRRTAAC